MHCACLPHIPVLCDKLLCFHFKNCSPGEQEKGKMGPNHPDYLDSLQYLAEFYLDLNRHTYAEPILIECLERRKNVLGPQNPDTIHTLDLLANLYDVLGK